MPYSRITYNIEMFGPTDENQTKFDVMFITPCPHMKALMVGGDGCRACEHHIGEKLQRIVLCDYTRKKRGL